MVIVTRLLGAAALALAAAAGACGGDDSAYTAGDADTDGDTDADGDGDADADSDTGEDETPPDLPALCAAVGADIAESGPGDGRGPALAVGAGSLLAWAYDPQEEGMPEQWRLQVGPYDPASPAVTAVEPFTSSAVALHPRLATAGAAFAVVWLDSRWDESCDAEDPDGCAVDVAFAELDAAGAPTLEEPVRITTSGRVARSRPAIAPSGDGWLLAWAEYDGGDVLRLYAQPADGALPAAAFSGAESVTAANAGVSLAALGEIAVAVWLPSGNGVPATPLALADGAAVGDTVFWDDGVTVQSPRIAAGADGFAVAWTRRAADDFEAYALLLDAAGAPAGEMQRLTWTTSDARGPIPAWSDAGFGVAWLSDRASGAEECAVESCEDQLFASILADDGALASAPVQLSAGTNPASAAELAWDGAGWTAAWELRRDLRQEVRVGRMTCE